MGTSVVKKVCIACGLSVAGKPRTKDRQGRYFCNPCWTSKLTESPRQSPSSTDSRTDDDPLAALAAASAALPSTIVAQEPGEVAEEGDDEDDAQHKVADNLMNCPDCGGWFNYAFMTMTGICKRCESSKQLARNTARNATAAKPNSSKAQKPEKIQTASARFQFYAGIVCVVSLLVAVLAAILNRDSHEGDTDSSSNSRSPAVSQLSSPPSASVDRIATNADPPKLQAASLSSPPQPGTGNTAPQPQANVAPRGLEPVDSYMPFLQHFIAAFQASNEVQSKVTTNAEYNLQKTDSVINPLIGTLTLRAAADQHSFSIGYYSIWSFWFAPSNGGWVVVRATQVFHCDGIADPGPIDYTDPISKLVKSMQGILNGTAPN
jgi:hypothetical protein